MQRKNFPVILMLGIVLFAVSCAKEGPRGPTGYGQLLAGNISGYVRLYDKYGSEVISGFKNVNLYITGSVSPLNPDSATGYYIYTPLYTNSYSIYATCSGYGATLLDNIQFVADTLNENIKLSATPDSFISSFSSVHNTGSLNDSLVITCTADTRARNCIVFVNKTATVSNAPANYILTYICAIPANATTATLLIPQQDLLNIGFTSGTTVYYAAYSYVVNDASVYEDLTTGKNIYNAVNTTAIVDSAIAP